MNKPSFLDITSWDDFKERLTSLNNKEKGNAFELLTKLYFQINPEHRSLYEEVWMLSEVPTKVLEHLELPSHDLGIDLIAKTGNEYHAIQCKYHSDKTSSVTFKEVSTFLSLLESNKKLFLGYICSSADSTSKNFQKIKTDKVSTLMSDVWQNLDEDFFKQANALLQGKQIKLKPFQPREHQKKALKEAVKYFDKEDHSRGKLIFPCGAGKSLTGFWMTQELKSKSTLIAVPSLSLVKQTLEVYLREIVATNKTVKWLCICSDEGIGKNDDVVIYTENLGVPCQTDPDYIKQWLKDNTDEEKIIFTTYQSGRIIAEISKKLNFKFDVGIFDEAHKTVGSNKKLFSHLLFEENIAIEKRIFMTATERFYTGSKDDIISMDDEDIYGDTFTKMSFKEAIEMGLLTDYKVITIDIKKSQIADFIRDNNLVQLNDKWKKETEARSLASMLALRQAMKRFSIKNAVSFHSSIEKAVRNKELQKHITETYNYDPIDTYTVSGKQSTSKRNDIVQEFAKSPKALITNARCLTEGVDVPNIDCIVFADPKKSRVGIVQALGRALRKKEGKDWGYVILPVIYNEKTQEIDNDSFNEILSVVRSLASNDERIIEYFKDHSGDKNHCSGNRNDVVTFTNDIIGESVFIKGLKIKVWNKLSRFHFRPFEESRAFVHKLNLKSQKEWRQYCASGNKPNDIPSAPSIRYKSIGWKGMGDWLGTGNKRRNSGNYKEFKEARNFVRSLNLKSNKEWYLFTQSSKMPDDIPTNPQQAFKGVGWKGFGDWLGNGNVATFKKEFRPFKEARSFARSLMLKSKREWEAFTKSGGRPDDIPTGPKNVYKDNGWNGYSDWLGTDNITTNDPKFRPFEQARDFARNLNLKTGKEWRDFSKSGKLPKDIPAYPSGSYKGKGWSGINDWLGTINLNNHSKISFRSFEMAREFARTLNLNTYNDWKVYAKSGKRPRDIPSHPWGTYKGKGWNGMPDFLNEKNNTSKN